MERSEWDDDDLGLPSAPRPAHERSWRHPSELQAAPGPAPSTLDTGPGRGLAMAAGTLGVVVGLGLLLLMLPSGSDGEETSSLSSLGAVLAPVSTDTTTADTGVQPAATDATTVPSSPPASQPLSGTPGPPSSPSPTAIAPSTPPPDSPSPPNTVQLTGLSAVALPLGSDGYLVTTAAAVAGRGTSFDVEMREGSTYRAMLVATGSGLAILRLDAPSGDNGLGMEPPELAEPSNVPDEGSWVTVFGTNAARAVLVATEDGLVLGGLGGTDGVMEGAPVVDASGRIIGLCSRSKGTTSLVLTHAAREVRDSAKEHAWLGVAGHPGATTDTVPRGALVVEVIAGSPAQVAGVLAGDDIVEMNGTPVRSILELADLILAAAPGDTVTLRVHRQDSEVLIDVVLGVRPLAT